MLTRPGRWDDTAEGALADLGRIEGLIADLLALARADAGHGTPRSHRANELDALVGEEATSVMDIEEVQPVTVFGDPEGLRRVVRNLIDNALRHATTQWWCRYSSGRHGRRHLISWR